MQKQIADVCTKCALVLIMNSSLYSWLISEFGYTVCWIAIEINVSSTKEREYISGRRQNWK